MTIADHYTPRDAEILIAEDSATQAELLRYILEERDYPVVSASNGQQALRAARARKPALIISDIVMPEMDGYALCRAVKSDPELRDIPVILVTTLSNSEDVVHGLECGADNFIRKPYEAQYLLARVEQMLTTYALRRGRNPAAGVEIDVGGRRHFISADRQQILDLLISTYEQAIHINSELNSKQGALDASTQMLLGLYRFSEGLNRAVGVREVAAVALDRALELPGVASCWLFLRGIHGEVRLVDSRNLPDELAADAAMAGNCHCLEQLAEGSLDTAVNIQRCDRLARCARQPTDPACHASVPLRKGERRLGVMNLIADSPGPFGPQTLSVLQGVGHQIAAALDRASLHEELELMVAQRTASLSAEVRARKQAESQLRQANELLAATQSVGHVGGWEWDLDREFVHWTAELYRLLDTEPERYTPTLDNRSDFMTADAWAELQRAFADSAAGEGFDVELEMRTATGRSIWARVQGRVRWRDGELVHCVAALQDISERRRTEAVLKKTLEDLSARNVELRDFAFVASHDLQEPLRKIRTFCDRLLIRCGHLIDETAHDYLARSMRATERMQALIDDLLAYSHLDAYARSFALVDLDVVVRQVVDDLETRIESSGGQVVVGVLPTLEGDATQLGQVFQNLIANALKFCPPERTPVVELSATRQVQEGLEPHWIIRVDDNGIGFAEQHVERIFAPFQRLHGVGEYAGTGFGLTIVRRIISRHHGQVHAEGRPGEGASFIITLPERQPRPQSGIG
jgi:signal transduction histidine kinase/DNA-binding response OmpR family regulator